MKIEMIRLVTIASLSAIIAASSLSRAIAENDTFGQTPSTAAATSITPRKSDTSISVFDGHPVVLGGLIREETQSVADKTADGGRSNLQQLLKERELLKKRLLEVEALIQKSSKE